jgi:hypothetical protein
MPLPGCCNCCHEPVTTRQKTVLFEGPNLRYPNLGQDSALFHTRADCRWDARRYDGFWARAVPGRVQKFPGWQVGEAMLALIEAAATSGPQSEDCVPVTLRFTGGAHDGAIMRERTVEEIKEVLYVAPAPPPHRAEPGTWYRHAVDCPCGASGSRVMPAGDHIYRPRPDNDA